MASSGWLKPWTADNPAPWPREIADYLQKWILSMRAPGVLVTDPQARLLLRWGDLARYGLDGLGAGESVLQQAYFLEGLLPVDGSVSILWRVETAAGVFADIHLLHTVDGDYTLLLDATSEVAERAQIEQALRQAEEQLRQSE